MPTSRFWSTQRAANFLVSFGRAGTSNSGPFASASPWLPPTVSSSCVPLWRSRQLGQVLSVPISVTNLFGDDDSLASFEGFSSRPEPRKPSSPHQVLPSVLAPLAIVWLTLLGGVSSLFHIIPQSRQQMHCLQLHLSQLWDHQSNRDDLPVHRDNEILQALWWWSSYCSP